MATVRDRLWIWGHEAGVHNGLYGLPGPSRMTPAEGAFYLDVPNIIMVRYEGKPEPPYETLAMSFRPLKQVVWSIVGSGGKTNDAEREEVLALAARFPNITGVMMDDFFKAPGTDGEIGSLSAIRSRLIVARASRPCSHSDVAKPPSPRSDEDRHGRDARATPDVRRLDLWVVLYDFQLAMPVERHLAQCDNVAFWTWKAENLRNLESNFERAEKLTPGKGKVLGCYMWDYGASQPIPVEAMQKQCETGLRWLKEGRIEGMIFLANCIADLGIEAVEWTRAWIKEVAKEGI